ncbi:hypothetical protein H6G97_16275 [Nostoc flagelliforme FACHB-838]|uniref:Uncharacterized protein n=1 Tax=Nostoc flagelliforme FACHB-838 TaxID=2692904 RepID=A0ABR8DP95_9NOSO|nr:hypothetical protein [Nostoc flagelliforme]MBD2531053.1 hypothetical protein [Nostoc flagelliforme FACHB-838]
MQYYTIQKALINLREQFKEAAIQLAGLDLELVKFSGDVWRQAALRLRIFPNYLRRSPSLSSITPFSSIGMIK